MYVISQSNVNQSSKMSFYPNSLLYIEYWFNILALIDILNLKLKFAISLEIYYEVTALRIHPKCANTYNCLGPTLGKAQSTEVSFDTHSLALASLI